MGFWFTWGWLNIGGRDGDSGPCPSLTPASAEKPSPPLGGASSSLLKSQTKFIPPFFSQPNRWLLPGQEEKKGIVCFYLWLHFISLSSHVPSSCHWKCYLSILLTAAVNRAQAVLHRWWEGRLHNSSGPIWFHISPLPLFSPLYLITETGINTHGQKRNEFGCS